MSAAAGPGDTYRCRPPRPGHTSARPARWGPASSVPFGPILRARPPRRFSPTCSCRHLRFLLCAPASPPSEDGRLATPGPPQALQGLPRGAARIPAGSGSSGGYTTRGQVTARPSSLPGRPPLLRPAPSSPLRRPPEGFPLQPVVAHVWILNSARSAAPKRVHTLSPRTTGSTCYSAWHWGED